MHFVYALSVLQNRYCFWYYRKGAQKDRDPSEAYESGIKVVESFQTVEHFWRIYNHILRADQVSHKVCMGFFVVFFNHLSLYYTYKDMYILPLN